MQTNTKNITQPTKQKKKKQIKSKYKQMQANTNKCKQIQTNAYKQNKQQRREPTRPKCQVRSIT